MVRRRRSGAAVTEAGRCGEWIQPGVGTLPCQPVNGSRFSRLRPCCDRPRVCPGRGVSIVAWLNVKPRGTSTISGTTRTNATGGPATTRLCAGRRARIRTESAGEFDYLTSVSGPNSRRVAYVDHPYAQFTAEGDEIPEVLVHPAKVTRLVRLSNERYNQTNTASQLAQTVSRAMARWPIWGLWLRQRPPRALSRPPPGWSASPTWSRATCASSRSAAPTTNRRRAGLNWFEHRQVSTAKPK